MGSSARSVRQQPPFLVRAGRRRERATLETDPFFCFHHVNAYEEEEGKLGTSLVTLDCAAMAGGVDFGINFGNLSAAFFQRPDWRASLLRLALDPRSGQVRAPSTSPAR